MFWYYFFKKQSKTGEKQKNKGKAMFILKELRTEHGLKRSELARETGINANTLANYEKGTRQASYETLILLADFRRLPSADKTRLKDYLTLLTERQTL